MPCSHPHGSGAICLATVDERDDVKMHVRERGGARRRTAKGCHIDPAWLEHPQCMRAAPPEMREVAVLVPRQRCDGFFVAAQDHEHGDHRLVTQRVLAEPRDRCGHARGAGHRAIRDEVDRRDPLRAREDGRDRHELLDLRGSRSPPGGRGQAHDPGLGFQRDPDQLIAVLLGPVAHGLRRAKGVV